MSVDRLKQIKTSVLTVLELKMPAFNVHENLSMMLLNLIYCFKTNFKLTSNKQCRLNGGLYTAQMHSRLSGRSQYQLHVKNCQCLSPILAGHGATELNCASLKYSRSLHMMSSHVQTTGSYKHTVCVKKKPPHRTVITPYSNNKNG